MTVDCGREAVLQLMGFAVALTATVLLLPKAGKGFNFQQLINVTIDNIFTTCRFLRHV